MRSTISRRRALMTISGAAVSGAAFPLSAAAKPTASDLKGNINHSVCQWCYSSMSLDDLAREAKEIGLKSIELLGPDSWPTLARYDLVCAMANGPSQIHRGFNRLEHHEWLVPAFKERIQEVADAGYPSVICFSGNRDGMDDAEGLENCAVGLKKIVGDAERAGVTICMELLNSRVDHPDYMCDRTVWGVELVKRVGSERLKLLYDIYHMQIMEGDVIRTIRDNAEYIGHYHTGGNPGRNEIDESQELFYPAIMRAILDTGFTGYVAQEFIPTREPMASLRQGVEICDV